MKAPNVALSHLECHPVPADLPIRVRDWPLWWFARLEAAVECGDHQTAARAQRELERLGVKVQFSGRHPIQAVKFSYIEAS
jgi:hypothetical protein